MKRDTICHVEIKGRKIPLRTAKVKRRSGSPFDRFEFKHENPGDFSVVSRDIWLFEFSISGGLARRLITWGFGFVWRFPVKLFMGGRVYTFTAFARDASFEYNYHRLPAPRSRRARVPVMTVIFSAGICSDVVVTV